MKRIITLLILPAVVMLQSCIEFEEEISFKKDGSGTYSMTTSMGKMMEMLGDLGGSGDTEGGMNENMTKSFEETMKKLQEVKGVSNVSYKSENHKFTITYDFKDVGTLNRAAAVNNTAGELGGQITMGNAYSWTTKGFERAGLPKKSKENPLEKESKENLEMAKVMMEGASYTTKYTFEKPIKKMSNKNAVLSEDRKSVTLKISLLDMIDGKAKLGNKIKFAKTSGGPKRARY